MTDFIVDCEDVLIDLVGDLKRSTKEKKEAVAYYEKLKQELYNRINEHDRVVTQDGEVLLTWKYAKDTSFFDLEAFKAAYPSLYNDFVKTRPGSRRLDLK